nr:hypothetical protein [Tanacetum cinerariifolium]
YAILNQLSTDFDTRFVPQTESSAEQAFWSQYLVQTDEPNLFGTTIVEVPKELPKVSMNIYKQMELAVEQHCAEKTKFQTKMENVLQENDRLLTQALSVEIVNIVVHDNVKFDCLNTKMENVLQENDRLLTQALSVKIVNIIVHDCMNVNCLNVDACEHCVTTESELKMDFIKKECYEKLLQQCHSLEKHCISLEVNNQLNMEIFQRDIVSPQENAPTFAELFEINELKAQVQGKDTVILKLKEKIKSISGDDKERKAKREVEEIETQNLELDHKEKVLVITALKEQLNKLKGKAVLTKVVSLNPINPALLQIDVAPLVPKLRKNRTAHTDYIRHTQEEAATLREIVESERLLSPLNTSLDYA